MSKKIRVRTFRTPNMDSQDCPCSEIEKEIAEYIEKMSEDGFEIAHTIGGDCSLVFIFESKK